MDNLCIICINTVSINNNDSLNIQIRQFYIIENIQNIEGQNSNPKMKTKNTNRSVTNGRHKSPQIKKHKPVHKEFQLIYRTRQGEPSSQQYESVFFMKHKKIQPEAKMSVNKSTKKKKGSKGKKKIQEPLNMIQSSDKTKKGFFQTEKLGNTKTTVPYTMQADVTHKSLFSESFRDGINMDQTRIKKIANSSNSNSSRYLDSKYLNKKQKTSKKNKNQPKSVGTLKSTSSCKTLTKINSPKNQKSSKTYTKKQEEYVFFNDQFVGASQTGFQNIEKLMKSSNRIAEQNEFLEDFNKSRSVSNQLQHNISQCQNQQQQIQNINQIATIKSYVNFKVVIIQRWWRSILKKRNERRSTVIQSESFCQSASQSKTTNKIVPSCMQIIERTSQLSQQQDSKAHIQSFLTIRQKTVLNYMNTQKNVLNRLLEHGKINERNYAQKLSNAQSKFQEQMIQINKMRDMMLSQAERVKILKDKINEENQLAECIQARSAQQILSKYFSQQDKQNSVQNLAQGRRKSTGCHITSQSQQENQCAFIRSPGIARQQFMQQSSDQQEENCNQQDNTCDLGEKNFEQLLEVYQDQQKVQMDIQKRYAQQVGMTQQSSNDLGINTSVVSIHSFLTNFLKFYAYFYKDQFLKLINMPYGFSPRTKLRMLQNCQTPQAEQQQDGVIYGLSAIIRNQALDDYHIHNYSHIDVSDEEIRTIVEMQKIHNRAIIDCFNQCINCFRPYYFVNGPPYLWNYSEKALTFYFIAEQNIQEVFQKTQYKVLRSASSLCGMMVDNLVEPSEVTEEMELQEIMQKYRNCVNPSLLETRQQKLTKSQKQDIEQYRRVENLHFSRHIKYSAYTNGPGGRG